MLGAAVQQIAILVICAKNRIKIGEQDQYPQDGQYHNIELILKKHAEHGMPIGISGGSDLFRLQITVIHLCE